MKAAKDANSSGFSFNKPHAAGSFTSSVSGPWNLDDEFTTGDGRRLRIVDNMIDAQPSDDRRCAGVWLVEPV